MKDENFNPENPLERFLYGSEADAARTWEKLLERTEPAPGQGGESVLAIPGIELCPETGVWISVVCDPADSPQRQMLLAHASLCATCSQHLRQAGSLFSEDVSAEEEATLQQLQSTSPAGIHMLAVQLAHSPLPASRAPMGRLFYWLGAAVTAMLIGAVSLGVWWQHRTTPERMLAEVYTRCRCYDLRMPNAGYSEINPVLHLRGNSDPQDEAVLQDARNRIEDALKGSPSNVHWLRLEARADLLQEHFDTAIAILDSLLRSNPDDPGLMADDAFAYYQRGLIAGNEKDRAIALERLRRADELAPGDTVVLFNEAIVMEDAGQNMNAIETWNRFLRFERDPAWLREGRQRLQNLEARLPAGK